MKIIIKIIIYYIITFNFISTLFYLFLTFVRTKRRRYCNNIKQDFTIFYVQIIIFEYRYICVLLEYIITLPYLEYPKNEDVIRKTAEFSGNNFDQATNDLDLRAH